MRLQLPTHTGQGGLTTSVPRTMFIEQWKVNSPAFSGVNSTVTRFPSGRVRAMPKSP